MSQRITIDLNQNPDVKNLISDMQVGDRVKLETSIVSMDDQTLILELDEAGEGSEASADDTSLAANQGDELPETDSPAMAVATGKVKV